MGCQRRVGGTKKKVGVGTVGDGATYSDDFFKKPVAVSLFGPPGARPTGGAPTHQLFTPPLHRLVFPIVVCCSSTNFTCLTLFSRIRVHRY